MSNNGFVEEEPRDAIQESFKKIEILANELHEGISHLVKQGEISGNWIAGFDNFSACLEDKSKTIARLEAHNILMLNALESALECLETGGFAKAYTETLLRRAIAEVKRPGGAE